MERNPPLTSTKPILDPLKGPPINYSGKSQIGLDIGGVLGKKPCHWLEIESEKIIYVRDNFFQTSHFYWAELVPNPNSNILLVTSSTHLSPWSVRTPFILARATNS